MDDIIIIGGGIAGISVAARLAKYLKVTLLEQEANLGYHASGRSAAVFIKDYGNKTVKALNHASSEYLTSAHGGVLSPRGLLLLGTKGDSNNFIKDSNDLNLDQVSIDEARLKFPLLNSDTAKYAAYRTDVHDLDTERLQQIFLKEAKEHNTKIEIKAKVLKIVFKSGHFRIITENNEYLAKTIVNAAGAWVDEIANLAGISPLKFTPYRRSIARVPVPTKQDASAWPILLGVNEKWYAKPDAGQLIVSPAEEEPVPAQDAWAEDLTLAEGIDRFQQFVVHPITRITSNWAGLRTFAPDRSLVIGPAKENHNFFWFGGQGGYGFQTAAAASELAKELILDQPTTLPKNIVRALSPDRFS